MKNINYLILFFLLIGLIGCSNDENDSVYTQSELETFLIRDCQEAIYAFDDENLVYEFDFNKTSEGNVGEYHRYQLIGSEYEYCNFIWEVEPEGNGGVVTMAFEEGGGRIRVRMGLMEQSYTSITVGPNGSNVQSGSEMLWKLDFKLKDDPFNGN